MPYELGDERMLTFIRSLEKEYPKWLKDFEKEALADEIPIIRKEAQSLLRFLMYDRKPQQILEVGAAVGFSGSLMAFYSDGSHIDTIERDPERAGKARENFQKYGFSDRICLYEEDAFEVFDKLIAEGRQYDMIFLDAAKAQYINMVEPLLKLLKSGGIIYTDNALQEGSLLSSKYVIRRRDRTIHMRMREYLYEINHNPSLETVILPVADGVAISVKK